LYSSVAIGWIDVYFVDFFPTLGHQGTHQSYQ
jgi:hypothetical protein